MKILLRIPKENLPLPGSKNFRDKIAAVLFHAAKEQYNEQAECSEAYLHSFSDANGLAEELSMIYGPDDPSKILDIAKSWNRNIMDEFTRALDALMKAAPKTENEARNWFGAPTTAIYDMKKAAMALNGDFYDYADQALLINEYGCFTTFFTEKQLADVASHPERYAVIDVAAK